MNLLRACKNLLMIEKGTLRDTNMELLRILAMLLIVMHHFAVHSGFTFSNVWSFNQMLLFSCSIIKLSNMKNINMERTR